MAASGTTASKWKSTGRGRVISCEGARASFGDDWSGLQRAAHKSRALVSAAGLTLRNGNMTMVLHARLCRVCLIHDVMSELACIHSTLKFWPCSEHTRGRLDLLNDAEVLTAVLKTLEIQDILSGTVSSYLLTIDNQSNGLLFCTTQADTKAVVSLSTSEWKVRVLKTWELYWVFA